MNDRNNSGFSLIEMSIVVLVIGFIIATVVGGRSIIRQANIRSVVSDLEKFRTAIRTFKDKYAQLPGDIEGATAYWPNDSVYQGFATANGNGNGKVEGGAVREDLRAWQHLTAAKMLEGTFSGELDGTKITIGKNIPDSDISGGGFWLIHTANVYNRTGNAIHMASERSDSLFGGVMNSQEAISIDRKIDDENATDGDLIAINGFYPIRGNHCVVFRNGHMQYNKQNTKNSCRLLLWIAQ